MCIRDSNWTQAVNGGNDAGGAWSMGLDMRHEVGNGLSRLKGFVCHSFLIDHDTTNAVTVKTQFKTGLANMSVSVNSGGRSSISLIEVLNP